MAPGKNASMLDDNHVDIGRNKVIQDIARAVAAGTVLFGSGACGVVSLTDSEGGGNKPIITSPGIPTEDSETNTDPTLANYELTPTPETTETMINPTPTYTVEASGEEFTLAQDELNQSEEALVQQDSIQRWLDYWIKFDDRPFAEDSVDIHWKYIYDNVKNPKEVWVLLEVGGECNNKLFTVPMNENGFVDFPPEVVGSNIEAGLGPLEIDSNKDGTFLSVRDGVPVRINSEGEVVERLIQAQWESVEKYPIDLEKLHNFPESYEYMVENLDEFVEAPDPLEDLEAFEEWVGELEGIVGEAEERELNYRGDCGFEPDYYVATAFLFPNKLEGKPEMAYFKHKGEIFPMTGINVFSRDGGFVRTMMVILYNGIGSPEGREVISTLASGGKIRIARLNSTQNELYPPLVNEAIEKGIIPVRDELDYNQIVFGMGAIQTEEGFQKMINGN